MDDISESVKVHFNKKQTEEQQICYSWTPIAVWTIAIKIAEREPL